MVQRFREEFRLRCFSLNYPDYVSFARSKWMSPIIYLIYRWVIALFFVIAFLRGRVSYKWYTGYFTGWGLSCIVIYLSLNVILCSYQYYRSRTHPNVSLATDNGVQPIQYTEELHPVLIWAYKILWMMFNIAAINSMIVTVGYWGALAGYFSAGKNLAFGNIFSHLLNGLVMLLEAWVTPFPVRILHVVYSELYGLLYIAQSVIYFLVDGTVFYYFLDYSNPGLATGSIFGVIFVLQPLVQLAYYGIYRLREWSLTKCFPTEAQDDPDSIPTVV